MSAANLSFSIRAESAGTISVRQQLLQSFRDSDYRHAFVSERVRSSVALQVRALRQARTMTQKGLGETLGMAQTWVSKLESPEYGKMTVATLLRLAEAFDTDLEIKFRPFSRTLDALPTQGSEYFAVPSFEEEFGSEQLGPMDFEKVKSIEGRLKPTERGTAYQQEPQGSSLPRKSLAMAAASVSQEQYGTAKSPVSPNSLAV
jgi:transcriptional regulator with XRE-family HTH domain